MRTKYREEAKAPHNLNKTSGAHGTIDPHLQRLGVTVALGLLPAEHTVYIYPDHGLKEASATKPRTPGIKDKGFFSLTMYGADKYIHDARSTLNNRVLKYNPDETFTAYCGPKAKCGNVSN